MQKRILWIAMSVAASLILALGILAAPTVTVSAAGAYDFSITRYDVEMNVENNREIAVTEKITAYFTGYDSHGIIRDFELGNGVRYQNIAATCDNSDFSPYFRQEDSDFLSYYLGGDYLTTGEYRTYTIRYTMIVPALQEGYLPIDAIGYGWQCDISNVTIRVTFPNGLSDYKIYSGTAGVNGDRFTDGGTLSGNTLTVTAKSLPVGYGTAAGITLDLQFESGVLVSHTDPSIWYALLVGVILALAAIVTRLLFFKKPIITTTVNLTAPEEMDPLKMGKLIDNAVDNEDLGAAVFYLADQGYLNIDMTNEKNPKLIQTDKPISSELPNYLQKMYYGIFQSGRSVTVSSLENRFYKVAEQVKLDVTNKNKSVYDVKCPVYTAVLGVLAVLLLGGFAWLFSWLTIGWGYHYWTMFVVNIFAYCSVAALFALAKQYENKWKKGRRIAVQAAGIGVGVLVALFTLFFPSAAFGGWTNFVLALFAVLIGAIGGNCLVYTKEHAQILGHILGFKQFILYTERDKIEFMLKDNPELYYHILPYAQVLGVTDAWTDKFKGLDLRPPVYVTGHSSMAFNLIVWNSMFRSMNGALVKNMISRPSSSGSGVNHGGGFGGGFGGGGFGGGGGRGF